MEIHPYTRKIDEGINISKKNDNENTQVIIFLPA